MFVRVHKPAEVLPPGRDEGRRDRARHALPIGLSAALAVVCLSGPASAQTSPAPSPQPPGPAKPPSGQPAPTGQPNDPRPSYQQPGYAQPPGSPQSYSPQGPPQLGPPEQAQPPTYGQPQPPPGYAYTEPPLPPPPKRTELAWSIRFQLLDLLFGRAKGELEYAFAGPFSIALLPEYVFDAPGRPKADGVTVSGGGIAGELGFWVEGRPLRGYFLKAHAGYRSIKFKSNIDDTHVPATQVGAMFGSQSVYGGWFTVSAGIGVVYDFQSEDRTVLALRPGVGSVRYGLPASGLFGNGFDLLGQLSIGGSF